MTADAPSTPAGPIPAGRYQIDPTRSVVKFRSRHLFGLASVTGTFGLTGGYLNVTDPIEGSIGEISVAAASFHTGNSRRDNDVHSARFLDVSNRPEITVRIDRTDRAGGTVFGYGTLHAGPRAAPTTITLTGLTYRDGELRGHAETRIDRYAHGLTAARGMAARHLTVTADVTARRLMLI